MARKAETFDLLQEAYHHLTKAGEGSLQAAHAFGNVVNALHSAGYSYQALGESIGRTGAMVSVYDRLYRKFPSVNHLLRVAESIGTYDVSRLAADGETAAYHYAWQCTHCGTVGEVKKIRQDDDAPEIEIPAQEKAHSS